MRGNDDHVASDATNNTCTTANDCVTSDSAVHDSAVHDSEVHDSAVHDSAVHDSAVHDSAVHDSAVHTVLDATETYDDDAPSKHIDADATISIVEDSDDYVADSNDAHVADSNDAHDADSNDAHVADSNDAHVADSNDANATDREAHDNYEIAHCCFCDDVIDIHSQVCGACARSPATWFYGDARLAAVNRTIAAVKRARVENDETTAPKKAKEN
jgi:hypothetical protein